MWLITCPAVAHTHTQGEKEPQFNPNPNQGRLWLIMSHNYYALISNQEGHSVTRPFHPLPFPFGTYCNYAYTLTASHPTPVRNKRDFCFEKGKSFPPRRCNSVESTTTLPHLVYHCLACDTYVGKSWWMLPTSLSMCLIRRPGSKERKQNAGVLNF